MLRRFISTFACSCLQKRAATDEPERSSIENQSNSPPNDSFLAGTYVERPKSRTIPIPSPRSWISDDNCHHVGFSKDCEACASFRMNRNKCRRHAEESQETRITCQDLHDLDDCFQFEPQAERNISPVTAGTSGLETCDNMLGRMHLPKNRMIRIGSIIESSDGSLPRITVANKASELLIFPMADLDGMNSRLTNLRETGIYYNTNSETVELHGGMLHNDYTI